MFSLLYLSFLALATAFPTFDQYPRQEQIDVYGVSANRHYFYTGGRYVNATFGNVTAEYMVGQIYVEKLIPAKTTQEHPLVFISGLGNTGTNWLQTPDEREGWASYFLKQGYVVYLTDQPERGRSPWLPGSGNISATSAQRAEMYWTAPEKFNIWPQAHLHTQWPGAGVRGDPIFDAFYATQVQSQTNTTLAELNNRHAYSALLDRIGSAILVTHSQAGAYGWSIADSRPHLVKRIVALEPSGPPFVNQILTTGFERTYGITDTPVAYEPAVGINATGLETTTVAAANVNESSCILQTEPAKKLANLLNIPILVLTSEAGYHSVYDRCTVDYLCQAGVNVTWWPLSQIGIHGNSHFMFFEKNNLVIAERIEGWLSA